MATVEDELILSKARSIMLGRMSKPGGILDNLDVVRQYLLTEYGALEQEQFGCMFLNRSYALINHNRMFRGTVGHCNVYPREVAREALLQNASVVILIHNHPAHSTLPTDDDIVLTKYLQKLLESLDIQLLDHFIVAGANIFSMRTAKMLD